MPKRPAPKAPELKSLENSLSDDIESFDELQAIKGDLEALPEEKREKVVRVITTISARASLFAGPLPPPEIAEQFEKLCPGFVDRSLRLVEKRQDAQIVASADERSKNDTYRKQGLWIAGVLAGLFVVCGTMIVIMVPEAKYFGLAAMFGGPIIGILGLFVRGRPLKDQNEQKRPSDTVNNTE